MKTLQGKTGTLFLSRPWVLAYSHVFITLFGSPSPNLVVLLNVTTLWGVGSVNLSYIAAISSVNAESFVYLSARQPS